jgi:hypothetical protein
MKDPDRLWISSRTEFDVSLQTSFPSSSLMQKQVYPGDLLQNTYQWNPETKDWYQNWAIQPGKLGHEGGVSPFGGGLVTDSHFNRKYTL